jgi:hypothetical protein
MQRTKKKLELNTHTIANLSSQRLAMVKGGLCNDSGGGDYTALCATAVTVCCVTYSAAYCAKG